MKKLFLLLFLCIPLLAQDSVKISLKDINQDIRQADVKINEILSGKKQGNAYFLQGQLNILIQLKQLGKLQNDSIKSKRGTNGKKQQK